MEHKFCPECQGELKPLYKDAWSKEKDEYKTIDGTIAKPSDFLCEVCKKIFKIETVRIIGSLPQQE